jgi:hypothetical protein
MISSASNETNEVWNAISCEELLNTKPKPPSDLEYRKDLLQRIIVDCIRCGDSVETAFFYAQYKAREFELKISDGLLRSSVQAVFDAWWSRPENTSRGGAYDFVLGSLPGADPKKGVFALGDVHIFQGASGSGKSSLAYHMLLDQRMGIEVFGRPTYKREFLVVMADRSANSLKRTLDNLDLPEDFPYRVLSEDEQYGKPADVLQQIWTQRQGVKILFVEGLDLWQKKIMGADEVGPLMTSLQRFAQDRHVAIIASIGSPKVKAKEGYQAPRDRGIGSSAWGRKADDIVDVVEDHDSDGIRHITLLPRTDKPQTWNARYRDGRLEEIKPSLTVEIDDVPMSDPRKEALALYRNGETQAEIARLMRVHERTVRRWLTGVARSS